MSLGEQREQWEAEIAQGNGQFYEAQGRQLELLRQQTRLQQQAMQHLQQQAMQHANSYSQSVPSNGLYSNGLYGHGMAVPVVISTGTSGTTTFHDPYAHQIYNPVTGQFVPEPKPEPKPEDEEIACGSSFGGELMDFLKEKK